MKNLLLITLIILVGCQNNDSVIKNEKLFNGLSYPTDNIDVNTDSLNNTYPATMRFEYDNLNNVYSVCNGKVISEKYDKTFGDNLIIRCKDYDIQYNHLSDSLVSEGDEVVAGELIASIGKSGKTNSTHLAIIVYLDKEHITILTQEEYLSLYK